MREMEILNIFSKVGAYQQGHFKLSSGLHSGVYLQCALVLQDPILSSRLCEILAERFRPEEPDIVIGPAMGGIVMAYEMARALNARAIFAKRDQEGKMTLRRGFKVTSSNRVLIAEDVLTTGKSINEVSALLKMNGVTPVGAACLVDRSSGKVDLGGIKHASLIKIEVPTFKEEECVLCREGVPIVKPGSRK